MSKIISVRLAVLHSAAVTSSASKSVSCSFDLQGEHVFTKLKDGVRYDIMFICTRHYSSLQYTPQTPALSALWSSHLWSKPFINLSTLQKLKEPSTSKLLPLLLTGQPFSEAIKIKDEEFPTCRQEVGIASQTAKYKYFSHLVSPSLEYKPTSRATPGLQTWSDPMW